MTGFKYVEEGWLCFDPLSVLSFGRVMNPPDPDNENGSTGRGDSSSEEIDIRGDNQSSPDSFCSLPEASALGGDHRRLQYSERIDTPNCISPHLSSESATHQGHLPHTTLIPVHQSSVLVGGAGCPRVEGEGESC